MIGENGCGKSTLLAVLGNREVPIQEHIDIHYLAREMPASEKTALECVKEADQERIQLEKLAEELATCEDEESQEYLMQVYEVFFCVELPWSCIGSSSRAVGASILGLSIRFANQYLG